MAIDHSVDGVSLGSANPAEAAAVAVAIEQHLQAERQAAATDGTGPDRPGRAWGFAGRIRPASSDIVRFPPGTPDDAWTAAGRVDRL